MKILEAIRVPGSKSISNRVLHLAALARGESKISGVLECDDTRSMRNFWSRVTMRNPLGIDAHHAGTVARFGLPVLPVMPYGGTLTGSPRLCERPMGELIRCIREMGGQLDELGAPGCLPVRVHPTGPLSGGRLWVRGDVSSQFVSGLMMAAPMFRNDMELNIRGNLVSQDYVTMTAQIMGEFGVSVDIAPDFSSILVPAGQVYQPAAIEVEGDWSSASYWFGLAAIHGAKITVHGLRQNSLQGDQRFIEVLKAMGCEFVWEPQGITCLGPEVLRAVDVDMHHISDTVPTLVAVSLFAKGRTVIRNVANMRLKESDRIRALVTEARRLGAVVEELPDGMMIEGGLPLHGASIFTYDDHRIAMSFGIVSTKLTGVTIQNPECASKTFPDFFSCLRRTIP